MDMPIVSQVYVVKGSKKEDLEDFVVVTDVDEDKGVVVFVNPFRDEFKLKVGAFNKKYVKGSKDDYDVFESVDSSIVGYLTINETCYPVVSLGNDSAVCLDEEGKKFTVPCDCLDINESGEMNESSLSVVSKGVDSKGYLLVINGKEYHYTSDNFSPKELEDKYVGIAKHSIGRALSWIKKNAKAKETYRKEKSEE